MKVTNKTTDENETSVELDLYGGQKLPKRVRDRIADEVGNYLVETTLISIEQGKSPVSGEGSFKALSPDYKALKKREGGTPKPNLEFNGDLKDQLNFEQTKNGVKVGVFGDRAGAADGHNNLSGKSKLPKRRFLPDEGQNYKSDTRKEVDRIIADIIAEESTYKAKDFKNINTATALYEKLGELLRLNTRREINLAVIRNDDLQDVLKESGAYDLLRF
jgi:hypothetical protein